ncbi:MAG: hypothetical protein HY231_09895 [Acidobacteria bacterium]|nr:hypothetical protein [Acidobacteriota bacterium]
MNLTIITQAISGSVVVADSGRDREFKRTRRQISEGIKGASIGAALLGAAGLTYFLIQAGAISYSLTLILALAGLIKLFLNIGSIVDARVGAKLVDQNLTPRATGGLNSTSLPSPPAGSKASGEYRRASGEYRRPVAPTARTSPTGALPNNPSATLPTPVERPPAMTGRVNREHSMPLRKLEGEDDLLSKLRN